MKILRFILALVAGFAPASAFAQATPLSMQMDRHSDPSPICANRLLTYSGCDSIGTMSSGHVFRLPANTVTAGAIDTSVHIPLIDGSGNVTLRNGPGIPSLDNTGKLRAGQLPTNIASLDVDGRLLNTELPLTLLGGLQNVLTHARVVSAAPSSTGNCSTLAGCFTGDLTKVSVAIAHSLTGSSLTAPGSDYYIVPETAARVTFFENDSGANTGTADNSGRTGAVMEASYIYNHGQGDIFAHWWQCTVDSQKIGATSFLANPACAPIGGESNAGADGVFLQGIGDLNLTDNGFDVAGISFATNMKRTNAGGGLYAYWAGVRLQSTGTQPIDVGYSLIGKANIGMDFTFANFGSNKAAITMTDGSRIYGNATQCDASGLARFPCSLPATYMAYSSSGGGWIFPIGGVTTVVLSSTQTTSFLPIMAGAALANTIKLSGAGTGLNPTIDAEGASGALAITLNSTVAGLFSSTGVVLYNQVILPAFSTAGVLTVDTSGLVINETGGAFCGGSPTSSFATNAIGIVIHC
jgi:hypothetical protein